jgi:hypothetical protein
VLDTSVFIAGERGRPIAGERLPDLAGVDVVCV